MVFWRSGRICWHIAEGDERLGLDNWTESCSQGKAFVAEQGAEPYKLPCYHPKYKNCLPSAEGHLTIFFVCVLFFSILCIVFFLAEFEHTSTFIFQPLSRRSHLWNTEFFSVKLNRNTWIVIQGARISIRVAFLHHVHKPRPHAERWIYLLAAVFTEWHFHCSSWQNPDDDLGACNELTEKE